MTRVIDIVRDADDDKVFAKLSDELECAIEMLLSRKSVANRGAFYRVPRISRLMTEAAIRTLQVSSYSVDEGGGVL